MGLRKGQTNNPAGRPKGTPTKKTAQWEALADSITGEQAEKFASYMNKLWDSDNPKDQQTAADLFIKTVEYFKPKQARVETQVSGDFGISSIEFVKAKDRD